MQGEKEPTRSGTPAGGRARPLPSAVALLCLFTSMSAAALGLGGAEVASGLNQPLDARIPLHGVGSTAADAIDVGLASRARLQEAGLDGAGYLDRLRFRVEPGAGGGRYVRVTSDGPIAEPFLRFLLRVDTGEARVIRDYTLLLDPPALATGDAAATTTSASASASAPVTEPEGAGADTASSGPRTWGPVASGSSAWEVAAAVKADDVSIYQMMVALLRANPGAFHDGDLGGLKAGSRLTVPSPAEVRAIPQAQAVAVYREHLDTVAAAAEASGDTSGGDTAGATTAETSGETSAAAGPVAARPLPELALISSAGAAREDGDTAPPAAGAGPRLPVRLDERLGDLAGAVEAVEERVATEGDSVTRALSAQSGQLDRVEQLLSGVRQDVAALREARPSVAPTTAADAGGLSYRTGVLMALGGLLLGGLGGYAAGRRLGARRAAPAGATAAAVPGAPEPVAEPETAEVPAAAAARAGDSPGTGISELEWEPTGSDGPAAGEDDHLFWADIYIAENLPREAEKIIRDAITLYGERPGYRVKLLEALYAAGAREQYLREATRYRAAAIDEGTWDEVVRMGRALAPDHPPFDRDADAAAAIGDDAGTGEARRETGTDPDAGDDTAVAASDADGGLRAPDLSELDEAIGDDAGDPEEVMPLRDVGEPPDRPGDEAAAEGELDPLELDPERPPGEGDDGEPGTDTSGTGDDDPSRGGADDTGTDDGYRKVAGRR